jgi:hypothetical protein
MLTYLARHWRGEHSLARSFWLNNVLLATAINGVFEYLLWRSEPSVLGQLGWIWLPMPFVVALVTWQLVGLWRSASRTVRERQRRLWPWTTKGLVAVNVLGFSVSLIVDTAASVQLVEALSAPELTDFKMIVDESRGVMIFEGALSDRAGDRLSAALENPRLGVLRLDSHGGLMVPAARVARRIRERGTEVVVEGQCISACVFVLASSPYATVSAAADVVLHRVEPVVTWFAWPLQPAITRGAEELYEELGVSGRLYRRMRTKIFWQPTLREMAAGGLIRFIIDPETGEKMPADVWCASHASACDAERWSPEE